MNDDEEVVLVESSSNVVSACLGFRPDVENFYQNFAFQLLPTVPYITLCGSAFHHLSCTESHFELKPGRLDSINKQCSLLTSDEKLSAILKRGSKPLSEIHPKTNNVFLSHNQLNEKYNVLRKERNMLQLDLISKSKRVEQLNSVLGLHKRLMVLLSQNDVLRVKELVFKMTQHCLSSLPEQLPRHHSIEDMECFQYHHHLGPTAHQPQ